MKELESVIAEHQPISLKEMDSVALLNRVDTKYIVSVSEALSIIKQLAQDYRILQIKDKRLFSYRTIYFDTEDRTMLYEHLRGKLNRIKVRSREYVGTDTRFFEVKLKTNKGRTKKSRIAKSGANDAITANEADFLIPITVHRGADLNPVINIDFIRCTFVNLEFKERVTFDFQLSFKADSTEKAVEDLVIIELKRASETASRTPVADAIKNGSVQPTSLSKYCLGMILLDETQRYNRYKPKLLKLNKLSSHGNIW